MGKWAAILLITTFSATARAQTPSPGVSVALGVASGLGIPLAGTLVVGTGADEVGFGIMGVGLVFGPAPGFVHAGRTREALPGLLIRAAAVGATAVWIARTDRGEDPVLAALILAAQMTPGAVVAAVSGGLDFTRLAAALGDGRDGDRAFVGLSPGGFRLVVPLP